MPPSPPRVPEPSGPPGGGGSVDMTVELAGLTLRSPVMTASGTFASGHEYSEFVELDRLGALVTKGVSLEPWPGNASPRIAETPSGMLNSIGLQNQGVERFCEKQLSRLRGVDVPVIVNVSGHSIAEYAAVIERLEREPGVAAYEVNISCPNVDEGGMAFGVACAPAAAVTRAVRRVATRPVLVKLSPNVTDVTEIARAVESEGADAISLINTLLGMSIDAETRRPRLARVVGGLSGPAIKPVALRMVWQVANAVALPIIGMGGIMDAEDAVEFMLAGATAVAVGTANFVDPTSTRRVTDGLLAYCVRHGVARVRELTGAMDQ